MIRTIVRIGIREDTFTPARSTHLKACFLPYGSPSPGGPLYSPCFMGLEQVELRTYPPLSPSLYPPLELSLPTLFLNHDPIPLTIRVRVRS